MSFVPQVAKMTINLPAKAIRAVEFTASTKRPKSKSIQFLKYLSFQFHGVHELSQFSDPISSVI